MYKTVYMPVKCSVVIPTYKRPHLLQKCLSALLQQQTNIQYEVIVVSDGKDEETAELMNEFTVLEMPFIYISLNKQSGPAAARNQGWQMAHGELIVFTDDDTIPSQKWLQNYWNAYLKNYKANIAFTGGVIVPVSERPTDYERNTAGLETVDFVTANCACTRNALQKINGFDENFTMAWREDSELEFKLMKAAIPIVKVKDAIVLHPVRKAKWGVSLQEQKKSMFNALLYKKHPGLFRSKILALPLWNYYGIIVSFIVSVVLLFCGYFLLACIVGSVWLYLVSVFILKRLKGSSLSVSHITEMIITSLLIPFLSVYWTLYGAIKFKVFFL